MFLDTVCGLMNLQVYSVLFNFLSTFRSTKNIEKRIHLIDESIYKVLNPSVKEKMVKHPSQGLVRSLVYVTN